MGRAAARLPGGWTGAKGTHSGAPCGNSMGPSRRQAVPLACLRVSWGAGSVWERGCPWGHRFAAPYTPSYRPPQGKGRAGGSSRRQVDPAGTILGAPPAHARGGPADAGPTSVSEQIQPAPPSTCSRACILKPGQLPPPRRPPTLLLGWHRQRAVGWPRGSPRKGKASPTAAASAMPAEEDAMIGRRGAEGRAGASAAPSPSPPTRAPWAGLLPAPDTPRAPRGPRPCRPSARGGVHREHSGGRQPRAPPLSSCLLQNRRCPLHRQRRREPRVSVPPLLGGGSGAGPWEGLVVLFPPLPWRPPPRHDPPPHHWATATCSGAAAPLSGCPLRAGARFSAPTGLAPPRRPAPLHARAGAPKAAPRACGKMRRRHACPPPRPLPLLLSVPRLLGKK